MTGGGVEVDLAGQTIPWLDKAEGWNSLPTQTNVSMKVSASVLGVRIGSTNRSNNSDWPGVWDPAMMDTDVNDIYSRVTLNFRNAGMYQAFKMTWQHDPDLNFPKDSQTVTFGF